MAERVGPLSRLRRFGGTTRVGDLRVSLYSVMEQGWPAWPKLAEEGHSPAGERRMAERVGFEPFDGL
jgi:hypothetical protein